MGSKKTAWLTRLPLTAAEDLRARYGLHKGVDLEACWTTSPAPPNSDADKLHPEAPWGISVSNSGDFR
jgi:hypothetical protein